MALAGGPITDLVVDMANNTRAAGPIFDFNVDLQPVTRAAGPIVDHFVDIGLSRAGSIVDHLVDMSLSRAGPIVDHFVDMTIGRAGPIVDHKVSFLLFIGAGPICDHLVEYCPLIIPLNPAFVNPPQLLIPVPLVQGTVGTGSDGLSPGTVGTEYLGAGGQGAGPGANPDEGD